LRTAVSAPHVLNFGIVNVPLNVDGLSKMRDAGHRHHDRLLGGARLADEVDRRHRDRGQREWRKRQSADRGDRRRGGVPTLRTFRLKVDVAVTKNFERLTFPVTGFASTICAVAFASGRPASLKVNVVGGQL